MSRTGIRETEGYSLQRHCVWASRLRIQASVDSAPATAAAHATELAIFQLVEDGATTTERGAFAAEREIVPLRRELSIGPTASCLGSRQHRRRFSRSAGGHI